MADDHYANSLIAEGSVVLFHRVEKLEEALHPLRASSYQIHELDCSLWHKESDFHDAIAKSFSFPDYYGRNLNAFNDCMRDVDKTHLVILLRRIDVFFARMPTTAKTVLDIFDNISRNGLIFGRRMLILAQSDDPRLRLPQIGGYVPAWNRAEWMDKDRGV